MSAGGRTVAVGVSARKFDELADRKSGLWIDSSMAVIPGALLKAGTPWNGWRHNGSFRTLREVVPVGGCDQVNLLVIGQRPHGPRQFGPLVKLSIQ
jgi:hypothetical protein